MKKYMAVSVNMDSLRHAVGYKQINHDCFYFEAIDPILRIAEKYKVPLTFYVIGKDLEYPEIAKRIQYLSSCGHEIANHTYSHPQDFGGLNHLLQKREIEKCGKAIFDVIGTYPKGFLSPGWSSSYSLLQYLDSVGYKHDSSFFSSPFLFLVQLRMILGFFINFFRFRKIPETYKIRSVIKRKDFFISLRMSDKPFILKSINSLVELPLPIIYFMFPYWFSLEFFNKKFASLIYSRLLKKQFTHLLVHPADFANREETDRHAKGYPYSIYRSHTNKGGFILLFEERIKSALNAGFEFTTMNEIASTIGSLNK